ncbi:MAG: type II toxin-antitoxin system Phd/YefM family antitoxin [Cyanobacteria bacterium P01_E01_bin.34]
MSTLKTISSREFNQDVSGAKRAAENGPVFITDRGTPAHVLLTVEDYYRLLSTTESVADMLAMPESADIEFEPTRTTTVTPRGVDLS